jgi:hypothetical protein
MNQQNINSHIRTLRIVADILNAKPTDWNPEGFDGSTGSAFVEIFHALYDQALVEADCLPVETQVFAVRGVEYTENQTERIEFRFENEISTVLTLQGVVIDQWAQQT